MLKTLILSILFITIQLVFPEEIDSFDREIGEYLLPGTYLGLTNQLFCFYGAYLLCLQKGWTLILPSWRIDYFDPKIGITVPFSYFFSVNEKKVAESSLLASFKCTEETPGNLLPQCLSELASASEYGEVDMSLIDHWVKENHIACINAKTSFYVPSRHMSKTISSEEKDKMIYALYEVLDINPIYTEIVQNIHDKLNTQFDTTEFLALHFRSEQDFTNACNVWCKREYPEGKQMVCLETEVGVLLALQKADIPSGTVILVMNGDFEDTDFIKLPNVCGGKCIKDISAKGNNDEIEDSECKVYKCVRKESLWDSKDAPTGFIPRLTSIAMVDMLIARAATWFLGNSYSTFSIEIKRFHQYKGNYAEFYNRNCNEIQGTCF